MPGDLIGEHAHVIDDGAEFFGEGVDVGNGLSEFVVHLRIANELAQRALGLVERSGKHRSLLEHAVEPADCGVDLRHHLAAAFAQRARQPFEIAEIAVGSLDRRADPLHRGTEIGDHLRQRADGVEDFFPGLGISHHRIDVVHGEAERLQRLLRLVDQFAEPIFVVIEKDAVKIGGEFGD